MIAAFSTTTLQAIGTTAVVVVEEPCTSQARRLLVAELDAIDRACSRFRDDSELMRANGAGGRVTAISGLFAQAVGAALRAAEQTGGLVDPTVAPALVALGYDDDFAAVPADAPDRVSGVPAAGWRTVELDARATAPAPRAGLPPGSRGHGQGAGRRPRRGGHRGRDRLPDARQPRRRRRDRGAGPAGRLARARDRRPPRRPRRRRPARGRPRRRPGDVEHDGPPVAARRARVHHIVDPRTGEPRRAGVADRQRRGAPRASTPTPRARRRSCAGRRAPRWLESLGLPARLVDPEGAVVTVGAWPGGPHDRSPPPARARSGT